MNVFLQRFNANDSESESEAEPGRGANLVFSTENSSTPRPFPVPGKAVEPTGLGPLSELEQAVGGTEEQALEALEAARARVVSLALHAQRAIAAGSKPNEFSRLSGLARACEAAQEILDMEETFVRHGARMQPSKSL